MSEPIDINSYKKKKEAEVYGQEQVSSYLSQEDAPLKTEALAALLSHAENIIQYFRGDDTKNNTMSPSSPGQVVFASETSIYTFEPIPEINVLRMNFDEHQYSVTLDESISPQEFKKLTKALDDECRDNEIIQRHNYDKLKPKGLEDRTPWVPPTPLSTKALLNTLKLCQSAELGFFNPETQEVYHTPINLKDLMTIAKSIPAQASSSFIGERFTLSIQTDSDNLIVNLKAKDGLLSKRQFDKAFDDLYAEGKANMEYVRENNPNIKLIHQMAELGTKEFLAMFGDELNATPNYTDAKIDNPENKIDNKVNNVVSMKPRM